MNNNELKQSGSYVIAVNNGEDYITLTGLGNTWSYSDKEGATTFDSALKANAFINKMPKGLILSVEPA